MLSPLPRRVGILLFDEFEPLDVFGPVELFGNLPEHYTVTFHAPQPGPVVGAIGTTVVAEQPMGEYVDILLVPGGMGTRRHIHDEEFVCRLNQWGLSTPLVTSVCTGSALLAAAGLLEGYRATSNKRAFDWAASFGTNVEWVRQARWVADRDRWTSSGVAAGMDMTAALIAELNGDDISRTVCDMVELEVHHDPAHDPFA